MSTTLNLQIGNWIEIPATQLDSVAPIARGDISGRAGVAAVMDGWSGGCLDTKRNRLIIMGGGHHGYAGNEMYAFSLESLTWERLTEPSSIEDYDGASPAYPDGRPVSRHTYNNMVYLPDQDAICLQGGANYPTGYGDKATWLFYVETGEWVKKSDAPYSHYENYMAWDAQKSRVIHHPNKFICSYFPAEDRWVNHGQKGGLWNYRSAVIDPKRYQYVIIGQGKCLAYDLSGADNYTQRQLATTGATEIQGKTSAGFVYDPDLDRLVAWAGGPSLYSLNLDSLIWERHDSLDGSQPGAPNKQGTFGRFQYAPALRGYVLVNRTSEHVWMFKLTGESTEGVPEPVPGIPEDRPTTGATIVRTSATYPTVAAAISAAQDNDVIEVLPGLYSKDVAIITANNLTIRCQAQGRAHLNAQGRNVDGKGTWLLRGQGLTVENMEFSVATVPDRNGAAIRMESPGQVTVRNCYFHHCDNGLLGGHSQCDIRIENSEFAHNGWGDGQSHNLYVNARSLTMAYCISHHCRIGHNVKSRCPETTLDHCLIYDGNDGTASNSVDTPNGGKVKLTRCYIQKGPKADNKHTFKSGEEGLKYEINEYVVDDCLILDEYGPTNIAVDIRGTTPIGTNVINGRIRPYPGMTAPGPIPEPAPEPEPEPQPEPPAEEPVEADPLVAAVAEFAPVARRLAEALERRFLDE